MKAKRVEKLPVCSLSVRSGALGLFTLREGELNSENCLWCLSLILWSFQYVSDFYRCGGRKIELLLFWSTPADLKWRITRALNGSSRVWCTNTETNPADTSTTKVNSTNFSGYGLKTNLSKGTSTLGESFHHKFLNILWVMKIAGGWFETFSILNDINRMSILVFIYKEPVPHYQFWYIYKSRTNF